MNRKQLKHFSVYHGDKKIISTCFKAQSFKSRLIGLIGTKKLSEDEALFFEKCKSIHCFFMSIPIDVIFVDKNNTILSVETVKPWGLSKFHRKAMGTLEAHAGFCNKHSLKSGQQLEFKHA